MSSEITQWCKQYFYRIYSICEKFAKLCTIFGIQVSTNTKCGCQLVVVIFYSWFSIKFQHIFKKLMQWQWQIKKRL